MHKFFSSLFSKKPGFTVVEVLIVLGIVGLTAAVSMPMYSRYIARNSMEIARQNIAQGLERAKFLAQTGMNDSAWGFSTIAIPGRGVLFMGDSFAERNPAFDELYSIPESTEVVGLTEVVFEKITGLPNVTGTITITTEYNEETSISVTLGEQGEVDVPEDWMEICTDPFGTPRTLRVPDALWVEYQAEGAVLGNCNSVITSSTASSTASSVASGGSVPSVGGGDGDAPGSGGDPDVEVEDDTSVTINAPVTFTADVICTELAIESGYDAPITVRFKPDGAAYIEPWGDFTKAVDGNVNKDGIVQYTSSTITADSLKVWARSYYKKKSWYDGSQNNHFNQKNQIWSPHNDQLIRVLRDGDAIPNYTGAGTQPSISDCISGYVETVEGEKIANIGSNQVLYLFELWETSHSDTNSDFQDLVLLLTFNDA